MQQVTLNIPSEKVPVLQQFLQVLGIKQNRSLFSTQSKKETADVTHSSFHPYYDWEFFMSELEYE